MGDLATIDVMPGESLGHFTLGASLYSILSYTKSQVALYPQIDLVFSQYPLHTPTIIKLRPNGVQLRFDAREQRLRMIEVTDFSKMKFAYKGHDVVRLSNDGVTELMSGQEPVGPLFKNVYKLFGPTTPGEWTPPTDDRLGKGIYCLSYPGISFNFWIDAKAWMPNASWSSVVSLLSSSATSPAWSMCVFYGEGWPKARSTVFTADLPFPLSPFGFGDDNAARDIECAKVFGEGRIELARRNAPSTWIITGETTPQDLVAELGPPDSIYKKTDKRFSVQQQRRKQRSKSRRESRNDAMRPSSLGTSYGSSHGVADSSEDWSSDDEEDDIDGEEHLMPTSKVDEVWYNYYRHGLDFLIGTATKVSIPSPTAPRKEPPNLPLIDDLHITTDLESTTRAPNTNPTPSNQPCARSHQTVTKIQLHGNIPGSWQFNRHRRLRWTLEHVPSSRYKDPLNSEMPWRDVSGRLKEVFASTYANEEEARTLQQPMALNRGWGGENSLGLGESAELLSLGGGVGKGGGKMAGSAESAGGGGSSGVGSTEMYGFPGLVFEVMKQGWVAGLLVY